jgi:molecular chaperone GrpE
MFHKKENQKPGPEQPEPAAEQETQAAQEAGDVSNQKEAIEIGREEYAQLLKKAKEFSDIQDKLLRSAADFDNAKKRLSKERDDFFKFALEGVLYDFLPVLDNFERAFSHVDAADGKIKSTYEGLRLIQKQLVNVLADRGLKRLESIGKPFDPNFHEAVGHIFSPDHEEGIVLEELVAGYELNGRLLRPAKVKVSTKEESNVENAKKEELT